MSEVIRASQFVVIDDEGRERARLGLRDGRIGLELLSPGSEVPAAELRLGDKDGAHLSLRRQDQTAELTLDDRGASFKLCDGQKKSACIMSVDEAGAWLIAESAADLGVRILCRHGGEATSIWLSEASRARGEPCVHTRFLRPDPAQDKGSQWCGTP